MGFHMRDTPWEAPEGMLVVADKVEELDKVEALDTQQQRHVDRVESPRY